MTNNFDTMNPATWTDTDREFLDAAMKLDPEETNFMIKILKYLSNGNPAVHDFICSNAQNKNYRLNTTAGRAAFLDAIQAI